MQHPDLYKLRECLEGDEPWVVMVHGVGGIGKTTLLNALAEEARALGREVVQLDAASMEPTEPGFLSTLSSAIGCEKPTLESIRERVARSEKPLLLLLDSYENFRLMDSWLRRSFLPVLRDFVRVVIASRSAPLLQWTTDPVVGPRFRVLKIGKLDDEAASRLLEDAGVDRAMHRRILRVAHGNPLALRLAALAIGASSDDALSDLSLDGVLHQLTRFYVSEIEDADLRAAVEATATVRRMGARMLGAMLGMDDASELYDRLAGLHFVEPRSDGLSLHDAVREFISGELQSRDPGRFAAYRRAAWEHMRREMRTATTGQLWRYTADLIYLLENPVVREAFFPSSESQYAVEPAHEEDLDDILEIANRHEPAEAVEWIRHWWLNAPGSFSIARDAAGDAAGFFCSLDSTQVLTEDLEKDPLTRVWSRDLQSVGNPPALFLRRWLSRNEGELPCAVQAACWLDLKRSYLQLRPELRRVYLTLQDLGPYLPVALRLGFAPLAEGSIDFGGKSYASAVLDFGPRSVDGWMARLFTQELGELDIVAGGMLDVRARQLVTAEGRQDLSPLEFGVLQMLIENQGEPVTRQQLLDQVWDVHHDGSSNVVDAIVRSLRRKMGDDADRIEAIRSVGYRYVVDE